jgi:hypothetical protein
VVKSDLTKRVTSHTFRHSFPTHLLLGGHHRFAGRLGRQVLRLSSGQQVDMNQPISEMDKQLRDTPRVNLAIAIEMNKGKRNACLFFGIIALAVILWLAWTKWLLLLPVVLGVGSFLYHMNILIVSSELRRRSNEPEQSEEPEATELPRRLTHDEIEERKRKLEYMASHREMITERAAEYMVEHPDESPDDVVDIVVEKCFLEHEIARLESEIRGHD